MEKGKVFDEFSLKVSGGSMRPLVRNGDEVRVKRWDGKVTRNVGDIVLYKVEDKFFIHRIVGIKNWELGIPACQALTGRGNWEFVVKDDAGVCGTYVVPEKDILGKVVGIKDRWLGNLVIGWLGKGKTGLVYNWIIYRIYKIFRPVKHFFYR